MYNIPIEVTKEQYNYLRIKYSGWIAYREESGVYYIKMWHGIPEIKKYLGLKDQ